MKFYFADDGNKVYILDRKGNGIIVDKVDFEKVKTKIKNCLNINDADAIVLTMTYFILNRGGKE
ncbi:hypothetical protein [Sulfurisphaera ohwakuensis]|uniref:Uncharacterized protein n=1 Tax=Sulfurisphaera ohwakuensis TaxID=69656 RepID=A0A650CDD9_SULOH|nr:hypothetical protein [Sulfurisphaera ohwakuensis]MBB5253308.1 hypothetical protein [Sulfurisphaera ohwakuensis]QGR15794.1 hypothetical protein D1869_00235 [Sulfurisphaera ohwakuensis]